PGAEILCCARRLAVRLCDCFFLGTAIAAQKGSKEALRAPALASQTQGRLFELQLAQLGPAWVRLDLVTMLGPGLVQIRGTDRAQSCAVLATEHLRGASEGKGVVDPGGQVELLLFYVRTVELLSFARPVDLAGIDLDAQRGSLQAAHAGSHERSLEAQ